MPRQMKRSKKTVAERIPEFEQHQLEGNGIATFAEEKMSQAITALRDIKQNRVNRTISTFDKEVLRQYLENISSNEQNLRNLSRFLTYRVQVYYRLIKYLANMLCMEA